MPHHILMYVLVLITGASVSIFLGIYSFKKIRNAPGGKYFCAAAFLSALFAAAYSFELTSTSLERILFWVAVEYIAIPFLPTVILLMCIDYTGRKLKRWMNAILFSIPLLTLLLHWTNSFHHLYYTSVGLRTDASYPVAKLEGGPWFWIQTVYLYFCLLVSVSILLWQLKKVSFRFQAQIFLMVIGLLIPPAATLFYLNGWSSGIDLGPISMCLSFLFHGAALLWFQMFDVVPIARETVFESLEEGVMVLNKNEVIVDYNQALKMVLPSLTVHMIGKPLEEVIRSKERLAAIIQRGQESDYQLTRGGRELHFHIRFASMKNKRKEIIGRIITFINVTERVEMEKQLQKLARMDGLTGVLNRTFFLEQAEAACQRLKKEDGSVSIIMLDIDHFKRVNDTFGHEAGDLVLKKLTHIVRENIQPNDLLARYGGEEFIIFLPDVSLFKAHERAEVIRTAIAEAAIFINEETLHITSSFGLSYAQLEPFETDSPVQMLMREADQALYTAKRNGRNRVQVFKQALKS
ncbi:histidine kinase N-terminal 7TM domain-containing diguanylate cyclase [Domibacillus robiginosus]|uniref:histidine kinase N-terminal 7TM domain-containing diguanylate cyclase n=1 Tax=Domibacillus robiginosus TaxID=1071054 RepID=UPI00067AE944|nr:histidine kinase N-terminal 7TM domain-containing protein [Domibacillus robiginosus]